jgi:tol-pal system protein YbgF
MRRIKMYVMTVGVALSVAPIFNYAIAQQGNSSTQLMLQVQTMRQEIGELRDLIDRQQFQLRRLQKQSDTQAKQIELVQDASLRLPPAVEPMNDDTALRPLGSQQVDANTTSANSDQRLSPVVEATQPFSTDIASATINQEFSTVNTVSQAVPQEPVRSDDLGLVPVVDRSFSTSSPAVVVTGAGTQPPMLSFEGVGGRSLAEEVDNAAVFVEQTQAVDAQAQAQVVDAQAQAVDVSPLAAGAQVTSAPDLTTDTVGQSQAELIGRSDLTQVPQQAEAVTGSDTVVGGSLQVTDLQQQVDGVITATSIARQVDATEVASSPIAQNPPPVNVVLAEEDYYAQGFELLKQSKYEEAASIFERQLNAHPRGDFADDAHYWIAEAMHVSRKLDIAKVHLKAIIRDYPQSRRLPDAMLKTAYIEQSQGNQIEARFLFQEIVNFHPQSDAAIAAKNQLAAAN